MGYLFRDFCRVLVYCLLPVVGFCEAVVFVFWEEGAEVGCCCSYYGVHEEGGLWWFGVSFDVACSIRGVIGTVCKVC